MPSILQTQEPAPLAGAADKSAGVTLLSYLSCSDPDVDAATYGWLELTPALADQLLSLHGKIRLFLLEIAKGGLVSQWLVPSFGLSQYIFTALRYSPKLFALSQGGPIERVAVIPPAEAAMVAPDLEDLEELVECFRVRIHEVGVQFSARAKYGDYEFTTEIIPLDLIRQAAGGRSELDRLEALAISLCLKDGDLDEAVIDLGVGLVGVSVANETADVSEQENALSESEGRASRVNNCGLRAQISWLLENAHGDVEAAIRGAAGAQIGSRAAQ